MDYRTLHAKTVSDLRLLAKQNGVKLPVGANKMRIVELILEKERMNAEKAMLENTAAIPAAEENIKPQSTDEILPEEKPSGSKEEAAAPKKRGRPPKAKMEAEEATEKPAPKKRGRPPKAQGKTETAKEDIKEDIKEIKEEAEKPKASEETAPVKADPSLTPEEKEIEKTEISRSGAQEETPKNTTEEKTEDTEKQEIKPVRRDSEKAEEGISNARANGRANALHAAGVRVVNRNAADAHATSQPRYAPQTPRFNAVRNEFSNRQPDAQSDKVFRRNPQAENAQTPGENAPRRELYGENGNGTMNAAVAEMLQNNECQEGAGVLEMHPEGYGFLRADNYLPGTNDVYVSIAQIRRFGLRNGDYIVGKTRPQREGDRYTGLVFINTVNGETPDRAQRRPKFEDLTPVYPDSRLLFENKSAENDLALRAIDLIAPVGKGQRGMIVSPPKAGKTVLLKKIANALTANYPNVHLIVLLIDERPEEVTDLKRSIHGEVVYSTFDETPENHTRLSEMTLDRAQRLVEMGKDVVILMDSITRLARAYNLVIPPTGRSLSGGLDPGALHKPKRFFGAARNIENGGSLTIIATALVETGSRMDDIIYEEFKGTGNMELHLDRKLSERRIFPAIDLNKSGTRREELLLRPEEAECALSIRRMLSSASNQDTFEQLIGLMAKTQDNEEFISRMRGWVRVWQKEGYSLNS